MFCRARQGSKNPAGVFAQGDAAGVGHLQELGLRRQPVAGIESFGHTQEKERLLHVAKSPEGRPGSQGRRLAGEHLGGLFRDLARAAHRHDLARQHGAIGGVRHGVKRDAAFLGLRDRHRAVGPRQNHAGQQTDQDFFNFRAGPDQQHRMVLRRLIIGAVNRDRIDPAQDLIQIQVQLEVLFQFLHRPAQLLFQYFGHNVAADFAGAELGGIQVQQPFGVGRDFLLGNGAGLGRREQRQAERDNQRDAFHTIISTGFSFVISGGAFIAPSLLYAQTAPQRLQQK